MAINVPAIALARGVVAPDNREVLWEDTSNMNLPFYERLKAYDSNSSQWRMVTQFPLELLNELRKVDGDGSGLDANFLQGRTVNDIIQLAKDGSFTLPNGFIFIGNTLGNSVARAVSGDATLSNTGTLSLIASGVTAGTYNLASLTIDAKGRITSASSYTITVNDIPELPQSKITNLTTDLSARELLANKENSVIDTSTTKYPTVNLLKIGLDTKEPTITAGTTGQYWRGDKTFQTLDKTAVGLSNVDNTSDADKPISSATALEFTNVYNEVSTKANNYVDIADIISGYTLLSTDAGKLITNSGVNVRTLVIPSSLNLPNNTIFIKGRIAIQPNAGVNIELPDTTIITSPTQFTCVADEVYILHKSAFTGDDYILVSVKKSENIGTNDLIITDTIRELQVATGGTFQIVTNDANNSAIFRVGENSNERFSEIELNSITYDVTTAEPNPTNNGAGIITRINPNEYEIESRSDIGNSATKRSLIYTSPNEVVLEKSSAGKLTLNSLGASNTFEDLRATKKGLEYSADYSANFSVRSLVDKGYVDSNSLYTNNGTTGSNRTVTITDILNFNGGKFALNSTTAGFLMPRVTTLQMNGIATPSTNELVFNTDLNAIYRYNGGSWVALSSGYGIIGVYSGSGNGTPTFFADLQSALETCKASGGYFTVKLYSNITITSAIEIDYTGSGVGNAYQFRQLTIDFNGFSVTNAQADTSHCFDLRPSNNVAVYQEIRMINGNVFRLNNTGSSLAVKIDNSGYGTIQMSRMFIHSQNYASVSIDVNTNTTATGVNRINDLGWSTISCQSGYGLISNSQFTNHSIENFHVIVGGADAGVFSNSADLNNFTTRNTSTGQGLVLGFNAGIVNTATNFKSFSNSGVSVQVNQSARVEHFTAISVSGIAVNSTSSTIINDFTAITGNNTALNYVPQNNTGGVTNGRCVNNSANTTVILYNYNKADNIEALNNGSGYAVASGSNQANRPSELTKCKATSIGGIGGYIEALSGGYSTADNCEFVSKLNTSSGHALRVVTPGTILLTNSNMRVTNSGANAINATSAVTVNSRYCTHNDVASTPINANVTIVSSGIIS